MRPSHCLGAAQERGGRLRGNVGGAGPLLAGQPPPPPPAPKWATFGASHGAEPGALDSPPLAVCFSVGTERVATMKKCILNEKHGKW